MARKSTSLKSGTMELKQIVQSLAQIGVKVNFANNNNLKDEKRISLIAGHSNRDLSVK
ncbi:hypothetical protein [Bacillus thuringiensis]|uniref:hypothetical protein n=1 Tax=Bacillus thuringiensis TaxID=1428 RepID=UPI001596BEFF|nr:hypothetical protein [Bacillus thuringiensis]